MMRVLCRCKRIYGVEIRDELHQLAVFYRCVSVFQIVPSTSDLTCWQRDYLSSTMFHRSSRIPLHLFTPQFENIVIHRFFDIALFADCSSFSGILPSQPK
jgi:hypothetical protein